MKSQDRATVNRPSRTGFISHFDNRSRYRRSQLGTKNYTDTTPPVGKQNALYLKQPPASLSTEEQKGPRRDLMRKVH